MCGDTEEAAAQCLLGCRCHLEIRTRNRSFLQTTGESQRENSMKNDFWCTGCFSAHQHSRQTIAALDSPQVQGASVTTRPQGITILLRTGRTALHEDWRHKLTGGQLNRRKAL